MGTGLTEAQAALPALSIMQPWAWLIVNGHKDIENRDWPTRFRGPVLIHAGKRIDEDAALSLRRGYHPCHGGRGRLHLELPEAWETGGIVGEAEIYDCVTASENSWFMGRFGFLIRSQAPVPLVPCKGALGFFRPNYNEPPAEPRVKVAKPPRPAKVIQTKPAPLVEDDLFSTPASRAALSERGGPGAG
jgi:hypothetical protein